MPAIPRLLAVSDRRARGERDWSEWCAGLAALGVDGLQVREPELADGELLAHARAARAAFPTPRIVLVNRRGDIARLAGADGVHLPAAGLPIALARSIVGGDRLVGRSTHTVDEVAAARDAGADYAVFGPVFDTPSKRAILAPRGLDGLAAATAVGLPVVAIGGVAAANAAQLFAAGAAGVAAVRAFADDYEAAALSDAVREATR
jgi:thiamine-phosphate pyrophosphorylase